MQFLVGINGWTGSLTLAVPKYHLIGYAAKWETFSMSSLISQKDSRVVREGCLSGGSRWFACLQIIPRTPSCFKMDVCRRGELCRNRGSSLRCVWKHLYDVMTRTIWKLKPGQKWHQYILPAVTHADHRTPAWYTICSTVTFRWWVHLPWGESAIN